MGEISKIQGKLEVKNGTTDSSEVIQEWKDKDGNIVVVLYANGEIKSGRTSPRFGSLKNNNVILTGNGNNGNYIYGNYSSYIRLPVNNGKSYIHINPGFFGSESDTLLKINGSDGYRGFQFKDKQLLGGNTSKPLSLIQFQHNIDGVFYIVFGHKTALGTHPAGHTYIYGQDGRSGDSLPGYDGGNVLIQAGEGNLQGSKAGNILLNYIDGNVGIGTTSPTEKLDITETTKTQGQRTEITRVDSVNIVATKSNYEFAIKSTTADVEIELLEPLTGNDGQSFAISIWDNTNNIEVLAFSNVLLGVDTITNTIGNTWRYTMNGSPDLSNISIGDKIKITNSTNTENNGKFVVTAVDDSSNYIEITNTNGIEELTNSPARLQELVYYETGFITGQYQEYKAYSVENTYLKIN